MYHLFWDMLNNWYMTSHAATMRFSWMHKHVATMRSFIKHMQRRCAPHECKSLFQHNVKRSACVCRAQQRLYNYDCALCKCNFYLRWVSVCLVCLCVSICKNDVHVWFLVAIYQFTLSYVILYSSSEVVQQDSHVLKCHRITTRQPSPCIDNSTVDFALASITTL